MSKPSALTLPRRSERRMRRESALVDAARILFMTRGYRGTTLEAIIAEAGGSREVIYRAFGGKLGLLSAVISAVGDTMTARIDPKDLATSPTAALKSFATALMSFWGSADGRAMNRMVFSEGMEAPEIVETWYSSAVRPSLGALTHYLEVQNRLGRLCIDDPPTRARQFLLLLMAEGAFAFALDARPDAPIKLMVDRSLDALLLGRSSHAK